MKKPKKAPSKPLTKRQQAFKLVAFTLIVAFLVWFLGMFLFGFIYQQQHKNDPVVIGASFSKVTAQDLGLDWQAAYTALIKDLKMKNLRLMSYWKGIEEVPGQYNFDDLDWQIKEAEKHGVKVTLSIGLRQPRWPECHQPDWASQLYNDDYPAWEEKLYKFIETVVNRYKSSSAIESWHLENEYFNRNFGNCDNFSPKRIQEEAELVKKADPDHPLVISLSDQLGFPYKGVKPDIFATSLYRGNHVKVIGYVPYPIPTHFYSAKAFFIKLLRGREIYIHELQLEPWGPRATQDLSIDEQNRYMDTDQIKSNINFALNTGMKKMYLWGAEWWYWRKVQFNDPTIWNAVKESIDKYQN